MDNISVTINGLELTEIPQSISFITKSFPKGSILTYDGKKYKLLQDMFFTAEQIED